MKHVLLALAIAGLLVQAGGFAAAQDEPKAKPRPAPRPAPPPPVKTTVQIPLTAKQIDAFLAAQKDMNALTKRLPTSAAGKADPKVVEQIESTAKKYGFKDFNEYDDVGANIGLIMSGIDPQTRAFQEPADAIKEEIAEVNADKAIGKAQKAKMLGELGRALKVAQPIQHKGNIELVKQYFEKIDAAAP